MPERSAGAAAAETVERYHEENKRAHAELDTRLRELEESRGRLEVKLTHIDGALERLEVSIAGLKPQPIRWSAVAALAMPVLLLILGWAWQASRYPERSELERVQATEAAVLLQSSLNRQRLDDLTDRVRRLEARP